MSTQQGQFATYKIQEQQSKPTDILGIIIKYLYHWPLFLIGIILSIATAFIYIQLNSDPLYLIKASLIIKDERTDPDQKSALREIDLLKSTKIIENEIEILKSNQLISKVVRDLQLGISYKRKEGLTTTDLYRNSPVKFTLLNPTGNYSQPIINVIIKDKHSFAIKASNDKLKVFSFKDKFKNSFGTWKLEPTQTLQEYKGQAIQIIIADPDNVTTGYQKAIDASLPNKLTTAIVLSIKDQVPERGKDILNCLILNYNLTGKQEQNRETQKTLDFLDQRIASLAAELSESEKGIAGFKSSIGLTDISAESNVSLQNLQANDARLNELNVQLNIIEGIERYINSPQNSGKAPATLGIADPALSSLIEKLSQLQLQRVQLLSTTPETNPDFEPINRQIATTKAAIKENVRNIKSSLLSTREKLQSYNSRFESSIKNIPNQERQYISIKRQQSSKESLYTYLLQKREEVSVNYASTIAHDRIVDQAYAEPVNGPKTPLIFAVALFLGISFPAGLIYGRDYLKGLITDIQDIKDTLNIPIVGELPFETSLNPININNQSSNALSEQFRALRTKLYYLFDGKESGRVTLFTSSLPGEGKSFISSNLALALAHTGRKTIILELDLRKPKLAEIFSITNKHSGISDFLLGKATSTDIIQRFSQISTLYFIGSGTETSNPSELLEQPQLKDLIYSLRNTYDDIIIDSPPVHLVPDAMILSRLTDLTLYIIRQGFTKKSELNFIKELNDQKQLTNINLIFNGIQRFKYGYGYNYKHDYYSSSTKKNTIVSSMFSDFSNRF